MNLSHTEITDQTFRSLGRHCHFLQYLSVAYSKQFTDRAFTFLTNGRGCRKLAHLDITGCSQLTSVGFEAMADAFRELEVRISFPRDANMFLFSAEFSYGRSTESNR